MFRLAVSRVPLNLKGRRSICCSKAVRSWPNKLDLRLRCLMMACEGELLRSPILKGKQVPEIGLADCR
jgi:hypothetical protein